VSPVQSSLSTGGDEQVSRGSDPLRVPGHTAAEAVCAAVIQLSKQWKKIASATNFLLSCHGRDNITACLVGLWPVEERRLRVSPMNALIGVLAFAFANDMWEGSDTLPRMEVGVTCH
jgi:hypothetical protein